MSQLKICRICLRTEAKLFKMNVYNLQYYYQEILAYKVDDSDRLPQYFCYECATLLQKFNSFKEKCHMGQKILKDMDMEGQITYESIYKVDKERFKLMSTLDMIQNTKVSTILTMVHKSLIQKKYKRDKIAISQEAAVDEIVKKESNIEHDLVDQGKDQENIKTEKTGKIFLPLEDETTLECSDNDICDNNSDHDTHDNIIHDYDICTEEIINKSKSSKNVTNAFIVANNNKDVTIKKLKARRLKQQICDSVTKSKKKYKIAWKFLQMLESGNWKKTSMSEEETLQNFRAKSQDEKYISAKYKCTDCFIFFSNKEILSRHRQKWHTELNHPFECRICKRRFRHNHQVTKHMKYHYNKFECQRCNLVCPLESTVLIHDAYHNGIIKKCEHCNKEFRHQSTYYSHIRTTHRSKYLCNLCGCSFVNELGLRQHKKRKHFRATEDELIVNKETSDIKGDINTYCSMCDIRFETKEAYKEHTYHTSKHNNIIIPDRQPKTRIHRKPTECPECGKVFDSQTACSKHYKNEHPNHKFSPYPEYERRHVCELCGATVMFKNLKIHLMNTHEKKNECFCNICGLKFSVQATLKRHSLVHTGEKPYKCISCDKRFTQKGSMMLHYRTFHLKEPYPKRIRKKKICGLQQNDSEDVFPESKK